MIFHMRTRVLPVLAVLLNACGSSAPKQDDLSAAAHRAEAEKEREAARNDLAAAEGGRRGETAPGAPMLRGGWDEPYPESDKQAGPPLLNAASEHSRHAREHDRAADALERFEDAACHDLAPESRPACPLLHDVVAIADVPGGVRVSFADSVPVGDVVAHIRCHLAYARAHAYADAEDCPLYVRGVDVSQAGPHAVVLKGDAAATVTRIRKLSREQALPAPTR
jgi:hypothetical protein